MNGLVGGPLLMEGLPPLNPALYAYTINISNKTTTGSIACVAY